MKSAGTNGEGSTVRLWSFQKAEIVAILNTVGEYRATWPDTPENWRLAYEWMGKRMAEATNREITDPPIWCWHSCNGNLGSPPTVGTATALYGSAENVQGRMVTLELAVPAVFVLLSSYHDWNDFLDYVTVEQRLPTSRRKSSTMFAEPLLKHDTDDIQAVIPIINSAWIQSVTELVVADRDWNAPLFPAS